MRTRVLVAALGVLLVSVSAIWFVSQRGGAYEVRRQRESEDIPGTLTLSLGSVPKGFKPEITPEEAFREAWDEPVETTTYLTLAVMTDGYYGNDPTPDWVFVARAQCYPSAKGDIVSPSRTGVPSGGCDERNLALVAVDAIKGTPAMSFTAYDASREWEPLDADPLFTPEQMRAAGGGGAPPAT